MQRLPEPEEPRELPAGGLAVTFEGVHFAYPGEDEVLTGVDLALAAGEIVAVCGQTGAGKSTLLNLLPRFYDPTAGRVLDRRRRRARRARSRRCATRSP